MDTDLLLFLSSSVAVTIAPGPDNLQVLARSLSQGRLAGVAAALGFASGCLFHTALAVLGVAAVLKASPMAFDAIRLAGAAYLVWLALQAFRSQGGFAGAADGPRLSYARIVGQSVLANVLNPKVTLFFLVYLPQFVDPWRSHPERQMLGLGVLFMVQAAVVFSLIALGAGLLGDMLRRRPGVGRWLDRIAGLVFLLLAVRIVWPAP